MRFVQFNGFVDHKLPTRIIELRLSLRPICMNLQDQGGLATAFDLAAFRLSMIAPVKKSVNHPKTVASMRGTGWENKFALAASSQRFGSVK